MIRCGLINQLYYLQAIREVGEVIQFYDDDKRFPAWGFGGRTTNGTVSHCFNLNGSASDFEVKEWLNFCNVSLPLLANSFNTSELLFCLALLVTCLIYLIG